jgi:hypothetical protein
MGQFYHSPALDSGVRPAMLGRDISKNAYTGISIATLIRYAAELYNLIHGEF